MDQARALLRDFNMYYRQTAFFQKLRNKGSARNGYKETPERLAALEKMVAWCRERRLDPKHWLQSLFVSRRFIFGPQWDQLTSEKHLKKYAALQSSVTYQAQAHDAWVTHKVQAGTEYDLNRDLSPSTEAIKHRYLTHGEAALCMARMETETLGYHPRSGVCQRCSQAQACEAAVRGLAPFDIMALRSGAITMAQAAAQERQHFYARAR